MSLRWSLAAILCGAPPAEAWDYFGHHVVGAIAWDHMKEETRRAAVELLLRAPRDAGLAALLPTGPRPFDVRARELFLKANGWADLVRDETLPERKARYDHPSWHYVNHFWCLSPSGPRLWVARGTTGELSIRLRELSRSVVDRSIPLEERAIDLAWMLHLAGDVHQPLHASARVTEREPEGDRGGNDFAIDDPEAENLHAYWDSILGRSWRKRHSESYFAWVHRVARSLQTMYPREAFRQELSVTDVEEWSNESARIAMTSVYPDILRRGERPSMAYRERALEIAERRLTLGAYRLARTLDRIFAGGLEEGLAIGAGNGF